ncbi:Membrane-associating domain family protein [Candida parapsilosis]|uniref:MARVEL domain-containing protein n=2 Tax=Candida parapsilosis TaxID=5480 RepID=G8BGM3_CANPC|nr:uncharacterized protein CPAR2_502450 [Candida parapsilosis]KAF6044626.1 Membrane-associating domain family protein [Candida parapsilosis]KAF6044987.1 Membrane-associating domain family protein [Candida parapsilosis]KAF6048867.1 Membrane-associating domain family protein [Candida parapsilosis]KAF6060867.1 Membrane-associating domain family protein [Candida parapsilosis]KAI5905635.1 hypothetical protein K4G60_g4895 [Candida parapsilosis]
MAEPRRNTGTFLRTVEFITTVAIMGLSGSVLAKVGHNIPRVSFTTTVAAIDILYLGYVGLFVPVALNNTTPSFIILGAQGAVWILYLGSWAAIAANFPTDCSTNSWENSSRATCRAYQALLPFSLFNWLLYGIEGALFLGYSYINEVTNYGLGHTFRPSPFYWGSIFAIDLGLIRQCCGMIISSRSIRRKEKHRGDLEDGAAHRDGEIVAADATGEDSNNLAEEEAKAVAEEQAGPRGNTTNNTVRGSAPVHDRTSIQSNRTATGEPIGRV